MNATLVGAAWGVAIAVLLAAEPHAVIWGAVILWCVLFTLLMFADGKAGDRSLILRHLHKRDNAGLYTILVDRILGGLTRMMSPETPDDTPKPDGWWGKIEWYGTPRAADPADKQRLQGSAWSWPVMDVALKLAVIYPLTLLLLQWAITGADTGIGATTILRREDTLWFRLAAIGPLCLYLCARILASTRQRRVFETAADSL